MRFRRAKFRFGKNKKRKNKPKIKRWNIIYIIKICIFFLLFLLYFTKINPIWNIVSNFNNNTGNSINRIFVCTLYNNEAETAYVHIWRLYDYVYKFIIVVSNITHSGNPKNITFKSFEKDIKRYMDKVDIVNFDNVCNKDEYPNTSIPWCIEHSQRDYAKTYIEKKYNPTKNDLLIVADLDEILTREGIQYIKKHPPKHFYCLKGSMYFPYYYHKVQDWDWPFAIRYNKSMRPLSRYRGKTKNNTLTYDDNPSKPLVTHCSYCFKSIEEYKNKLKSFAHEEYSRPPYTTNNWIFRSHYCRAKLNSYPGGHDEPYEGWKHLIPDDKRLKYLMDPSFIYPLNETSYTEKDLENMCFRKFNRTPFE